MYKNRIKEQSSEGGGKVGSRNVNLAFLTQICRITSWSVRCGSTSNVAGLWKVGSPITTIFISNLFSVLFFPLFFFLGGG